MLISHIKHLKKAEQARAGHIIKISISATVLTNEPSPLFFSSYYLSIFLCVRCSSALLFYFGFLHIYIIYVYSKLICSVWRINQRALTAGKKVDIVIVRKTVSFCNEGFNWNWSLLLCGVYLEFELKCACVLINRLSNVRDVSHEFVVTKECSNYC